MGSPLDRPPSKAAIVTGGSRGVGGATACWLAGIGFAVVVNYATDEEAATASVESIHDDHGMAIAVRADVALEADVARVFHAALDTFGGVDAVVHAVIGQVPAGALAETSAVQFDALYALNARAAFLVNREAARQVRRGGGIANLTSRLVSEPVAACGAHAASRAATDVITRVLALELAARDISVNAIALTHE